VDWSNRLFHQWPHFAGAQFHQRASFMGAQFHQGADFEGAQFHGEASFRDAQFHQRAYFGDAQFHQHASFWGAQFHQRAYFGDAQFHQRAYFGDAQFRGEVRFPGTRFSLAAETDFSGSTVGGHLHFVRADFPKGEDTGRVLFSDVVMEKDGEVLFEGLDLSRASFLRTDLSRVRFRDVRWATRTERVWAIPWLKAPRQVLFDHLEKEEPHLVGELYRQLRLNLEPARQEIEAGDFYIGQMDMRRQDTEHFHWSYRWLLGFYRFVALYGESWQRPLVLYFLLGFAFALVYLLAGFEGISSPIHYRPLAFEVPGLHFLGDYAQALAHALTAGGILQQDLHLLSPWAPLVRYANALADIFLLALTVIALRRRFRR